MNKVVSTIEDYISLTTSFTGVWFRGVASPAYKPHPRVHWNRIESQKEETLVYSFLRDHFKYHFSNNENPWYLYALMQHHGLPTRLLDWTRSPLVSLYFALTQGSSNDCSAVVWVLNPYILNEKVIGIDRIFCPSQMAVRHIETNAYYNVNNRKLETYENEIKFKLQFDSYLPANLLVGETHMRLPHPFAIETIPLDSRMSSQQSVFTIHGSDTKSLDEQFSDDVISCIEIPASSKSQILDKLHRIGIVEDFIYCDLDSLSKRLCREQGL